MTKNKINTKKGSRLQDGKLHKLDHLKWTRRDFIQKTGFATFGATFGFGNLGAKAFQPSPLLAALDSSDCDRILLMIRLSGGNDGLNTMIPRGDSTYYNLRPTIAIQENDMWTLSDEIGMHSSTQILESMWEEGRMKVVQNVGYPQSNYSHFRGSDIWASASDRYEYLETGWIGRMMDLKFPAFIEAPPIVPPALEIGARTNMIFRGDAANMALAVSNPQEFYQIASSGQLYDTNLESNCVKDLELNFIRHTANSAFRYSETIKEAYDKGTNNANYPDHYLGDSMAIVSRLIKGDLGTRVFMVTLGGFDTHANQFDKHNLLLNRLAEAVSAFYDDLKQIGYEDKVLTMTFSEFGRTPQENGSLGTDHGTSAPMMFFGPMEMGSELLGTSPDLSNLNNSGDPIFEIDFRSVYKSVMEDWMCVDKDVVEYLIDKEIDPIPGLVPEGEGALGSNAHGALLGHNSSLVNPKHIEIKYAIQQRGIARLRLLNEAGYTMRVLFNEFKDVGSFTYILDPVFQLLDPGTYIYQLDVNGRVYNRKIKI